jgi:hypothetical protein
MIQELFECIKMLATALVERQKNRYNFLERKNSNAYASSEKF